MNIKQKIAAAAVGVALLGGGAGLAVAMGGTSSASTSDAAATAPTTGPAQKGARKAGAQFLRRVVHGDLTVRAKDGFEKVAYDRGKVTSKTGNSFTLQRPDNVTVTITVDSNTKYRGITSVDELTVNKPAIVVSKDGTALTVAQRNGASAGRAQAPAASSSGT